MKPTFWRDYSVKRVTSNLWHVCIAQRNKNALYYNLPLMIHKFSWKQFFSRPSIRIKLSLMKWNPQVDFFVTFSTEFFTAIKAVDYLIALVTTVLATEFPNAMVMLKSFESKEFNISPQTIKILFFRYSFFLFFYFRGDGVSYGLIGFQFRSNHQFLQLLSQLLDGIFLWSLIEH